MTTKGPYVSEKETNKHMLISRGERERYKTAFDRYLKPYKSSYNFSKAIDAAKTFQDLSYIAGKLELPLLFNISMSRLIEFSPDNLKEFAPHFDSASNLTCCLEEEIGDNLKLPNFDNKSSTQFKFNVDFDISPDFLKFDFFKTFREFLFQKLEFFSVKLIVQILKEITKYIDEDRINRCTVPCEKDRNPFKNMFTKAIVKTGTQTLIFFQEKVRNNNLNISPEELQRFVSISMETLTPDEIDCLLKGIISSDLFDILRDLFDSLFDNNGEDIINRVFEEIDQVVDFVPGADTLSPTSPCGDLHLERLRRLQLEREGKTETQINNEIAAILLSHKERLGIIADVLQRTVPYNINISNSIENDSENPLKNPPITENIINKSIDATFDSLGKTYVSSMASILAQILVSPIGETCIAYFHTQVPNTQFNIAPNIQTYIESQLVSVDQTSILDNPITFILQSNFYSKYKDYLTTSGVSNQFLYLQDRIYMASNGQTKIIVGKGVISALISNQEIEITSPESNEVLEFIALHSKESGFKALIDEKNHPAFKDINISFPISLLTNLYDEIKVLTQTRIGKDFFFSEFNRRPNVKPFFAELDYFQLEIEKERVKVEING